MATRLSTLLWVAACAAGPGINFRTQGGSLPTNLLSERFGRMFSKNFRESSPIRRKAFARAGTADGEFLKVNVFAEVVELGQGDERKWVEVKEILSWVSVEERGGREMGGLTG
eukprot:1325342-Amorphochlora_amoeboformis.AAC.3